MGGIDVASVVTSIVSAFGSGMDIFHRLSRKPRKTNARLPRPAEEEEWLRQSLKSRPVEIRHEFDQQVAKFGRKFEVGDAASQSSLAHTLLVLNTGLINLINHALSGDPKTISTSRRTLYNLSETAAVDTMTALGQLSSRLSLAPPTRTTLELKENRKPGEKHGHRDRQPASTGTSSKQAKRPPPTPLLARGGWVRSKSGSSVVSGTTARKARTEHAERHNRTKSESALPKPPSRLSSPKKKRAETRSENSTSPSRSSNDRAESTSGRDRPIEHLRPQRQPSMLIVPADFFENIHETKENHMPQQSPPRPPKIPLERRPVAPQTRIRPTSTMTFMTASTKIGEIPESRWADRELSSAELHSKPMPYTIPPPLEPIEQRKKKGFKFWRREEKRQDIAAF